MVIYDTEEEQVAAIKGWWRENGKSTILGVAVGIAMIVGWNYWQDSQKDKAYQASALFEQLQENLIKKDVEATEKVAKRISTEYGSTGYADYSALLLAKTKVQQGDLEAASIILKQQIKSASSVELKNIARIRLIKLLQETNEYEKGLQLIAEVDQSTSQGFSASYDELTGDLYVALDRLGEARTAYQSALRAGANTPLLQFKLDDITAADIETNK